MSPRQSVRFAQLDELVEHLGGATNQIAARLDELDVEVSALRGEWSGAASDAYALAHHDWAESLRELHRALADSVKAGASIAARYRSARSTVDGLWS